MKLQSILINMHYPMKLHNQFVHHEGYFGRVPSCGRGRTILTVDLYAIESNELKANETKLSHHSHILNFLRMSWKNFFLWKSD